MMTGKRGRAQQSVQNVHLGSVTSLPLIKHQSVLFTFGSQAEAEIMRRKKILLEKIKYFSQNKTNHPGKLVSAFSNLE